MALQALLDAMMAGRARHGAQPWTLSTPIWQAAPDSVRP
jgi:hypothetical protein